MHFESFSNTFCQKVWQDSEPSTAGRAAVPRVRHERSGSVGARRAEKLWLTHTSLRYFPIPVPRCVRADYNPNPTRKYLTLSENTRKSTISALTQRALSLNIMRFSVRAMNCRINSYRYQYTNSNLPEVFLTKSPSF